MQNPRASLWLLLILIPLSCNKPASLPASAADAYIQTALSAFWTAYSPDTAAYTWSARYSTPLWSDARILRLSIGPAVCVPVATRPGLTLHTGAAALPAGQITWLLLYRDTARQWHIERLTRIPLSTPSYEIRIEDWQGNFLRAYLYSPGVTQPLTESHTFTRANPGVELDFAAPNAPKPTCTETDWYACSTIGDGPTTCEYAYTTEECSGSANGGPPGYAPPGGPSAADYTLVGVPTGSPTGTGAAAASIKPDTSITNHPFVECVYAHLMNPNLNRGLKSILSNFDDGQPYNVTFTLSSGLTDDDGTCAYLGNNAFLITINASEAEDSSYSRIYLASTFIHEAFHARLRQKVLETFGTAIVDAWPKPIYDMTLSELASYFELESKDYNIWDNVEHDWMVNNISTLATSLQQFVQTYYKSTSAAVGDSLAPYEALMYMGLQDATLYREEVVNTGLDQKFKIFDQELNEGGKCQD